jgi:hypothetical protein
LPASPLHAKIVWPAGVCGIIVHRYNTIDDTVEDVPTTAGDASIIEGLLLEGAWSDTTVLNGHGIWMRARAVVRNVLINRFAGNGINIVATSGSGSVTNEGNANCFKLDTIRVTNSGEWGVFIDGADVNAGVCVGLDVTSNGTGGLYDSSFLGNTHIGHHAASNGAANVGANAVRGRTSIVTFDGNRYYANDGATAAQLVATTPGTNAAIWVFYTAGGTHATVLTWTPGQPEGTYFVGASYKTSNVNAKNVFIGCYTETGFSPAFFVKPTLIFGGLINAIGGAEIASNTSRLQLVGNVSVGGSLELGSDGARDNNDLWSFSDTGTGSKVWSLQTEIGRTGWQYANLGSPTGFVLYDREATIANGYARDFSSANGAYGVNTHYLGSISQLKLRTVASSLPTTGSFLVGDIYYRATPTAGGFIGWVCTTSGTGGTLNGGATTGSTVSGTDQLIVNSATGITPGVYISIAGVSGTKLVKSVSGTTITLTSTSSATVTDAVVAYVPFVFKDFGAIAA